MATNTNGVPPLPVRGRGGMSSVQAAAYKRECEAYAAWLLGIRSRLDFATGRRGWCYLMENAKSITKGQFDVAEKLLDDWRKSGLLPLDFCASDAKRAAVGLEKLHDNDPAAFAADYVAWVRDRWKKYEPVSFWKPQPVYIEVMVEKIDLRGLFESVCVEFHVPIWNAGGWSDINSRAESLMRFRPHLEAGRAGVLLYCGDFDPKGLQITDTLPKNLIDLEGAVGWPVGEALETGRLTIERFGLNFDFIEANDLPWIDGLETGSGKDLADPKHPDHKLPYVQDYLWTYCDKGEKPRKVEANALVVRPEAGRELCREAILRHISQTGIRKHRRALKAAQAKAREALLAEGRRVFGS
jgi:hypothetical protein